VKPFWPTSATTSRVARTLGLKKVFDLNYSNHQMDQESRLEIRAR